MKIGYDAKRLFTNFTGLGNYSRSLVSNYHNAFPGDELYLFTPGIKEDPRTKAFLEDPSLKIIKPSGFKPLWRSLDILDDIRNSSAQIYHGLSHELPIGISKLDIGKVVTIHDLIFKYFTKDHSWLDRKIYDLKWKHSCVAADIIIAISEQTKNDLMHYYNVGPQKIRVIYQSADRIFSDPVADETLDRIKKKYHLPSEYNLYVGSVISRKNLLGIIKAMAVIKDTDRVPLVIIGQGKDYKKKVIQEAKRIKIDHLLLWLGSPPFRDFPAIYKNAQMMIYTSLHEGFGLPVIEAMHVGIPVITSDQSSLKEAGGNAAYLVNPSSPDELSAAVLKTLSDTALRQEMIKLGREHCLKFNSDLNTGFLRKEYEKLL